MRNRDDYTRMAEALDAQYDSASIRIDSKDDGRRTLIIDLHGTDHDPESVKNWVTDRDNLRDIYGFGAKHLSVRTQLEHKNVLVAIEGPTEN